MAVETDGDAGALDAATLLGYLRVAVYALTALLGTLLGLIGLLTMVLRGKAHAGLPMLNGGTIAGYLVGALLAGVPLAEAVGLPL